MLSLDQSRGTRLTDPQYSKAVHSRVAQNGDVCELSEGTLELLYSLIVHLQVRVGVEPAKQWWWAFARREVL